MRVTAKLAHYVAGLITGFSFIINNTIPFLLSTLFILYELWEMLKINDRGYLELRQYAIGVYTAIVVQLLLITLY